MLWDLLMLLQITSVVWVPICILSMLSMFYCRLLGYRTTISLGIVGVPVHELSHLLFCVLFNHKVIGLSLYKPCIDGTLGYVSHQYRVTWFSPFANLIIGLAPIAGGVGAFIGLTYWLRPDVISAFYALNGGVLSYKGVQEGLIGVLAQIVSQGGFYITLLWLMMSFSLLLFCAPSKADFYGCRAGVLTLVVMLVAMIWAVPEQAKQFLEVISPLLTFVGSLLISTVILTALLFATFLGVSKLIRIKLNALTS
ncbi:MAG: hypothetical protein CML22_07060 [Rheinheimera sp.]|nr:hypothetical protein [Rheinheimera sp.]MBM34043.1 hypothetical protein [Rheinheimera sp.]|tara:strand:- start:299 stop:1057 length:759 start_codon:yes stop_codon:yes gene_type:complete